MLIKACMFVRFFTEYVLTVARSPIFKLVARIGYWKHSNDLFDLDDLILGVPSPGTKSLDHRLFEMFNCWVACTKFNSHWTCFTFENWCFDTIKIYFRRDTCRCKNLRSVGGYPLRLWGKWSILDDSRLRSEREMWISLKSAYFLWILPFSCEFQADFMCISVEADNEICKIIGNLRKSVDFTETCVHEA